MNITIGVYPNGDTKYNIVSDEHLEDHIAYNKRFRPGRMFYVNGKRVCDGCVRPERLGEYDKIAEEEYKRVKSLNMCGETIPFR